MPIRHVFVSSITLVTGEALPPQPPVVCDKQGLSVVVSVVSDIDPRGSEIWAFVICHTEPCYVSLTPIQTWILVQRG